MPTWGEILIELNRELSVWVGQPHQPGDPSPYDTIRRRYIAEVRRRTGRNVILYASKWTQGPVADPNVTAINPEDVQGFMEVVHNLEGDDLDIIIHSPGGSAEAAEAVVTYLRSKFKSIRVFVPHAAMSAATMFACAGDRIVMGKHSFLGPIDPQFIMQTELGVMAVPAHSIVEQFRMAQTEISKGSPLASWIPILRQYGPALLVQCQYQQKLAVDLVSTWLRSFMFKGQRNAARKAKGIARKLSDHARFKTHNRFIGRDQAKQLKLTIEDLETDQGVQDGVLSVFHMASLAFTNTPLVKVIENHLGKTFLKQQQTIVMQAAPQRGGPPPGP
jgi:hypothetical protein